jgi:hypothetical protein
MVVTPLGAIARKEGGELDGTNTEESSRSGVGSPQERSESARKAGQASGKARLLSLTAKQRSAIARKAALARWGK